MTRVACIDIGTVTARLAVADVEGGRVVRLIKHSEICNLGEGVDATGRLRDDAIGRVFSCVRGYVALAVEAGALSLEKLEAMTCVCSVGLDMIAIPGDTSVETIAGIIADEMAIGVINNKTTAVRIIPAIGKGVGDSVEYGGLFGRAPVMPVNQHAGTVFAHRGGRFPAPLNSLKN